MQKVYMLRTRMLLKGCVMKGYDVSFELYGCVSEISRRVILPERLSFAQLKDIIISVFGFSTERYSEFNFKDSEMSIDSKSNILIDRYITRPVIYDNYWFNDVLYGFSFDLRDAFISEFAYPFCDGEADCPDDWRVIITLNETVSYEKTYPTLISYAGECNPVSGSGGINTLNSMLLKGHSLPEIDPKSIEYELTKIKSLKHKAYNVRIRYENTKKDVWRDFLIPEKTTFPELEDIIIIAFDTDGVSFESDDETVDESLKRKSKTFSKSGDFSVELKNIIFSARNYPILKVFSGGENPFDLWHEYYPDASKETDRFQTNLDDFF